MNKKLLKRIFPIIAVLLLAPWPVAYAYDTGATGQETVQIEVAEAAAQPTWTAFGHAIGGVEPGELFHINAADNPTDIVVTLYLTNADELIGTYRYLILEVGFQVKDAEGNWQEVTGINGQTLPETFITLRNGQVSFTLPGLAEYKLNIDGGSFNCNGASEEDSASPQFYLEVDQV